MGRKMLQEAFSPQTKSLEVLSLHWHFHVGVLESMKIEKKIIVIAQKVRIHFGRVTNKRQS